MTSPARSYLAISLLLVGCFDSQQRGEDAGLDAAPPLDGGAPPDTGAADAGSPADGGVECIQDGLIRCGGDCPERCPTGTGTCFSYMGYCELVTSGCTFHRRPAETGDGLRGGACTNGWPCLFRGEELPEHGARGSCVRPELCLLDGPDVPPHRCFWGDGTEVTRLRPRGECPTDEELGGVGCGDPSCDEPDPSLPGSCFNEDGCAGPNDERGFGLCHLGPTTCGPDQADKIELCTRVLAEPCTCMIFDPPAPSAEEPYGYLVPLEGCRRYSERFPGQVRCEP